MFIWVFVKFLDNFIDLLDNDCAIRKIGRYFIGKLVIYLDNKKNCTSIVMNLTIK